jgi:hypothetical protein
MTWSTSPTSIEGRPGIIGREFTMDLRQIKDRSNLANEVVVRNNLIKVE